MYLITNRDASKGMVTNDQEADVVRSLILRSDRGQVATIDRVVGDGRAEAMLAYNAGAEWSIIDGLASFAATETTEPVSVPVERVYEAVPPESGT